MNKEILSKLKWNAINWNFNEFSQFYTIYNGYTDDAEYIEEKLFLFFLNCWCRVIKKWNLFLYKIQQRGTKFISSNKKLRLNKLLPLFKNCILRIRKENCENAYLFHRKFTAKTSFYFLFVIEVPWRQRFSCQNFAFRCWYAKKNPDKKTPKFYNFFGIAKSEK